MAIGSPTPAAFWSPAAERAWARPVAGGFDRSPSVSVGDLGCGLRKRMQALNLTEEEAQNALEGGRGSGVKDDEDGRARSAA